MTPPVKGAQVLKGGGGQRRLSQKPKFVVFFLEAFPNIIKEKFGPKDFGSKNIFGPKKFLSNKILVQKN